MNNVKVVIPLYKTPLPPREEQAVRHNAEILGKYPLCVVVPQGMPHDYLLQLAPHATIIEVSDKWLGVKNGIAGYNRMMTSRAFYDLFSDSEYILVCQSDAWIFRDELQAWCDKGYDYIGAPWIRPPKYDTLKSKIYLIAQRLLHPTRRIHRTDILGKVGNGGLSLRKTASFADACDKYTDIIEKFGRKKDSFYNEDVFWAMIPQEFRYPSQEEALKFAIDENPDVALRMNGNQLPMGCHGCTKDIYYSFWEPYLL
ncbi:MAG: hypothetical protein IJY36_04395 [Coprobacter sp.]|nr:hypothetical protein [Coprobacter sp.]